ncbi:MAG: LuxR C-terminal-related transcriptional regulator [Clostridiales Family XIII bacterium]|jgi:LuxR family maltose regulon positive regulatory protein|nr:LuxR C-terminal-related transcriptional regulator [Clostridiales Family XIII bacterium]
MHNAKIGTNGSMPAKNFIMTRPRVETILSNALEKPVTLVYAGAGCGKSYAVYSYLLDSDIRTTWMQLSTSDNNPSRFWETMCNMVSQVNSELAVMLAGVGFPGTGERYKIYYDCISDVMKPTEHYAFVFDDVHLITDPEVMSFLLALTETPLPGAAHVFISREETIAPYDVGTSDEDFVIIDEKDLLFTKVEVADYMAMLEVDASPALVDEVFTASEGLAHLVNLAGKLVKKRPGEIRYIRDAIKRNITKQIYDQFFEEASEDLKKYYVRLSLLDHLSDSLVHQLPGGEQLIGEAVKRTSLIRYDTYMGTYHIHHMFLEFLHTKEGLLSEEEKAETYAIAAAWCADNNYKLEAMGYYEKTSDYISIIGLCDHTKLDMGIHDALYLFDILDRAPESVFDEIPIARVLYTKVLLSLGRLDEVIENLNGHISVMESKGEAGADTATLVWLYCNLGFAKILQSTDTGEYDFAWLFEKADEYMKKSGMAPPDEPVNSPILSYACTVGNSRKGDPEKYIEEVARSIHFTNHVLNGCLYGSDDLAVSEVAYYRGDMAACERYAVQSCLKARERGQSYIEGRALFLLLRMNLARGRYHKIVEVLSHFDELAKRHGIYMERIQHEIVLSWYYASIDETDDIAPWVKSAFLSSDEEAFITGLEDIAKQKYYLSEKKYHTLLAFMDRRPMSHGIRKFIIGRIGILVSEAVCHYNLKNKAEAMEALKQAYDLAAPNAFDMPFIEMGNHMRSLAGAMLREKKCDIPPEWLELIRSKSATYAKRVAHVRSSYRQNAGKNGDIQLTLREKEVLQDMAQGLSRAEIAVYRNISVNTVKAMLQIIYEKLGADNSMDALRIAISENLI